MRVLVYNGNQAKQQRNENDFRNSVSTRKFHCKCNGDFIIQFLLAQSGIEAASIGLVQAL
jgi:hypothetical protein